MIRQQEYELLPVFKLSTPDLCNWQTEIYTVSEKTRQLWKAVVSTSTD